MSVIGGGSVTHAGTFGANGASMAAAKAVLEVLSSSPVLEGIRNRGQRLKEGMHQILNSADLKHQMTGHPSMQGFVLTEHPVNEVRDLVHHDEEMYDKIMTYLYHHGVWPENDAREPWFLCESHTDKIIDETLNKFEDAVKSAKD